MFDVAYFKKVRARVAIQSDNLNKMVRELGQARTEIASLLLELDKIITEHEIRTEASKT